MGVSSFVVPGEQVPPTMAKSVALGPLKVRKSSDACEPALLPFNWKVSVSVCVDDPPRGAEKLVLPLPTMATGLPAKDSAGARKAATANTRCTQRSTLITFPLGGFFCLQRTYGGRIIRRRRLGRQLWAGSPDMARFRP